MNALSLALLCALTTAGGFPPAAQTTQPAATQATSRAAMDKAIRAEISRFKGEVGLFAKNLDTGETYGIRENERVRTASTIKVPIMVEVFGQVAEGKLKWTDEIVVRDEDKVPGSGIIHEFSSGVKLTLRDCTTLMIVLSDNSATNMILDRITADAVNRRMEALGFTVTRSMRKTIGDGKGKNLADLGWSRDGLKPENKGFGIGISTPREMVTLFEKLERGEVISPEASQEMIGILKRQQYRDGIGRTLKNVTVASKPGSLDHLRSDVAIVYTPKGRIAIAVTCDKIPQIDESSDNPAFLLMSRVSQLLIDGLGKK